MKKMIVLLIFFIMIIQTCAFGENQESLTLNELFSMFDKKSPTTLSLFNEQPHFEEEFMHVLTKSIKIKSSIFSYIEYDAALECRYISLETCIDFSVNVTLPKESKNLTLQFANEVIDYLGEYNVEMHYFDPNKLTYTWKNAKDFSIDRILQGEEICKFTFIDGTTMNVYPSTDELFFQISKVRPTPICPIGAGLCIGDSFQCVIKSPAVNILTREDSKLTLYSQIASYPAYFELQFNEGQRLTHAKVFVAGVYTLESKEYPMIDRQLRSVYETINEYGNKKLVRITYKTKNTNNDITGTICIHEIKEEEGAVYHTLTFMPEEEYNRTLFLDYLNN